MNQPTLQPVRLRDTGANYPDGRPMGHPCRPGCRAPRENSTECHCRACHNSFGGLGFFDSHRHDGWCINPVVRGMVFDRGLWATEEGHAKRRALVERAAVARQGRN